MIDCAGLKWNLNFVPDCCAIWANFVCIQCIDNVEISVILSKIES